MTSPPGTFGGPHPSPSQLSRYLRTADEPDLRRRRAVVALSLVGVAMGQVVGAYQVGLLRHLPDPPIGPFDADAVDASEYAYRRAATPDGFQMIATYAVTALLAAAGGQDRPRHHPALPLLLGAKVAADVATNLSLAKQEWADNKALCGFCQFASVLSIASLPLALPEAARAWRSWRTSAAGQEGRRRDEDDQPSPSRTAGPRSPGRRAGCAAPAGSAAAGLGRGRPDRRSAESAGPISRTRCAGWCRSGCTAGGEGQRFAVRRVPTCRRQSSTTRLTGVQRPRRLRRATTSPAA